MTTPLSKKQLQMARLLTNTSSWSAYGQTYAARGGQYAPASNLTTKHNFNFDFGYPTQVEFADVYQLYKRNGVAHGVVNKTIHKTWETNPALSTDQNAYEQTPVEQAIQDLFDRIRFWQQLMETDKRSLVGRYSGVIFQLADGKPFDAPVGEGRLAGGANALVSLIPAWEGQLIVSEWDQNQQSDTYGQPLMMTFSEASVDPTQGKTRSFQVHPDRVYVWSQDRTTFNDSRLEPVYDALVDIIKLRGSGAEGFWKNAKSQPVLEAEKDLNFQQLAQMLGTDLDGLPDALDQVVADWNDGFDQSLVLQGMQAKTLGVTLPQPEEFYSMSEKEVAAAWDIPMKVLFGNQTGERASTEDAAAWNRANMSRRTNLVQPNIEDIITRLQGWGVLPDTKLYIQWEDLTGSTDEERFRGAKDMAEINFKQSALGGEVFPDEEIRARVGYAPLEEDLISELDDTEVEE